MTNEIIAYAVEVIQKGGSKNATYLAGHIKRLFKLESADARSIVRIAYSKV